MAVTRWAIFIFLTLSVPQLGRAAVIETLDLEQLTTAADRVVIGAVGEARSLRSDDGRRIVTDTWLEVEQTLKGAPVPRLLVRTAGGVVGELGQRVPGAARLTRGDRVLLFLEDHGQAAAGEPRCRVVALAYGVFLLVPDGDGGALALRDVDGLATLQPRSGRVAPLSPEPTLDLTLLLRRIRTHVVEGRGTPLP